MRSWKLQPLWWDLCSLKRKREKKVLCLFLPCGTQKAGHPEGRAYNLLTLWLGLPTSKKMGEKHVSCLSHTFWATALWSSSRLTKSRACVPYGVGHRCCLAEGRYILHGEQLPHWDSASFSTSAAVWSLEPFVDIHSFSPESINMINVRIQLMTCSRRLHVKFIQLFTAASTKD
jgi:hypothetical protein